VESAVMDLRASCGAKMGNLESDAGGSLDPRPSLEHHMEMGHFPYELD